MTLDGVDHREDVHGIADRVAAAGGLLEVTRQPGAGTVARAEFALDR